MTTLASNSSIDTQTKSEPEDSYLQSFAHGLEVILSFNVQTSTQTLGDVDERVGLTRAGARRILLTLTTPGQVVSEDRQFRLAPRIFELDFANLSSMPIWSVVEPMMGSLVSQVVANSSCNRLGWGHTRRSS